MARKDLVDQAMRSSVERAMRLQPRGTRRMADELLYTAPAERETVAAVRAAGARMVEAGLALPTAAAVAARHGPSSMTISRRGVDVARLDGRHLVRLPLDGQADDDVPETADLLGRLIAGGAGAAVWAHPVSLLACAAAGIEPDGSVSSDLAGSAETVTVVPGRGVVAAGHDPQDAVSRLEAAERLAEITLAVRSVRRTTHG
jgi:ribulose-5-phosphate 4-epimerase/fuculose-1-phosphate aldolase